MASLLNGPYYPGGNLFEPLVYYCGTLKNITNDAANQRALVKAGSLHVLSTALSIAVAQVCARVCWGGGSGAIAHLRGDGCGVLTSLFSFFSLASVHASSCCVSAGRRSVQKSLAKVARGHTVQTSVLPTHVYAKVSLPRMFS